MVLEETGKWRGRAQEIARLQTKLKQMKRQIAAAPHTSTVASTGDAVAAAIAAVTGQAIDDGNDAPDEYATSASSSRSIARRAVAPITAGGSPAAAAGTATVTGGERQRAHLANLQASRLQEMDDLLKSNIEHQEAADKQRKKIQALTARQRTVYVTCKCATIARMLCRS
jgi:hypothetical protein